MSLYDPCTQKIKARMFDSHLLSTIHSINSLVKISSHMAVKIRINNYFFMIYFLHRYAIELDSTCAASVMDRTQDSGSWNVGSTPTWRILFHKVSFKSVDKSTFLVFNRILLSKKQIILRVLPLVLPAFLIFVVFYPNLIGNCR